MNRVKQIDGSVFQLAKQLVPLRANFQTGVVIESTVLQRSKLPMNQPEWENMTYSGSIDITETTTISSYVQDMTGDSVAESYYLFDTTITTPVTTLTASYDTITGSIAIPMVSISMFANEYNQEQTFTALVGGTFPEANIDLFDEGSSQYTFIETIYSGSQWTSSLNPYWRRDPYQPAILEPRLSEMFNLTAVNGVATTYDMFYNSGSFTGSLFTSLTDLSNRFGMTFDNFSYGTNAISTVDMTTLPRTASVSMSLPSGNDFYYNFYYDAQKNNSTSTTVFFEFKSSGSILYTYSSSNIGQTVYVTNNFETPLLKVDSLTIRVANNTAFAVQVDLTNFKFLVAKRARVQDFNYLYEGKVRQLYKGTQQTSQDFNIDSDDTTDKGPVIIVQEVNPNILRQAIGSNLGNTNLDVE